MKKELRKKYMAQRDSVCADEKLHMDIKITEAFLSSDIFMSAESLFIYVSMGSEVDTSGIILSALNEGKVVATPRVKGRRMDFYRIYSLEELVRSNYGILEPEASAERLCICDSHTVMAVPGLAFSGDGYRIGYGGGYYDRYLAENKPFASVGLAYHLQMADELPHNDYDIAVDKILTEAGWLR